MLLILFFMLSSLSNIRGNIFQPVSTTCKYWDSLMRYTNGEKQKLHCILDESGNEGLVNTTWKLVSPGWCPIFNRHVKQIDTTPCDRDLGRCPDIDIRSYQAVQYDACYGRDSQNLRGPENVLHHIRDGNKGPENVLHHISDTSKYLLVCTVLIAVMVLCVIASYLCRAGLPLMCDRGRKLRSGSKDIGETIGKRVAGEAEPMMQISKDSVETTEESVAVQRIPMMQIAKRKQGQHIHAKDSGETTNKLEASGTTPMIQIPYPEQGQHMHVKNSDIEYMILKHTKDMLNEFFTRSDNPPDTVVRFGNSSKLAKFLAEQIMQKCERIPTRKSTHTSENRDTGGSSYEQVMEGNEVILKFRFKVQENKRRN